MPALGERKTRIKSWFKNHYNLLLIAVILVSFIIRLIFFLKTANQPVWWDEGEYLSMAQSFISGIKFDFNPQRPVLYPALLALLMLFKVGEPGLRLITVFLPSLLSVAAMYYLGKTLYNEKVALISAFLLGVSWDILFNTARFHTDLLALLFSLLSIYFFWKYYVKEPNIKRLLLSGLFLALAFMTRPQAALIGLILLIYVIATENYKFLLKKELWITLLIFLIAISPLVVWNMQKYGNPIAQTSGYVSSESLEQKSQYPITWNILTIFPLTLMPNNSYYGIILFIALLIGLATFFNLVIGFDIILKNKDKKLNSDLLTLLILLIPLLYFLLIERPIYGYEPRWLILAVIAMFIIIAKGFSKLDEWLNPYIKWASAALIIILLIITAIPQISQANAAINEKKESYLPVKLAALWLKEHTSPEETIFTKSPTQVQYYSGRYCTGIPGTYEKFIEQQSSNQARFVMVSRFEKHADWIYSYPKQHPEEFTPVYAYPENSNQPEVVIYLYTPKASPKTTS